MKYRRGRTVDEIRTTPTWPPARAHPVASRRSPPRSPGCHRRQRRRGESTPCVHIASVSVPSASTWALLYLSSQSRSFISRLSSRSSFPGLLAATIGRAAARFGLVFLVGPFAGDEYPPGEPSSCLVIMDPKHSAEVSKHLDKQNQALMETYRAMSHELHKLQVEEETIMRKLYELMSAEGLLPKCKKEKQQEEKAVESTLENKEWEP